MKGNYRVKRVTLREGCVDVRPYLAEIQLFTLNCCGLERTALNFRMGLLDGKRINNKSNWLATM